MSIAEDLGVDADVVVYRKEPLDEKALRSLIKKLEDEPTALVRRDSLFKKLELTEDDVQTEDQIVQLLVDNKMLLQRPIVVKGNKAIVGRPKERITELLS